MVLWIPPCAFPFRVRVFHPLRMAFPKPFPSSLAVTYAVRTPGCTHPGLGSSGFARRYSRNRCFFLFLRLLRCFSSPGSPPYVMDWRMDDGGLLRRVSPFRYLRINGYLLLPEAFRSLSRLSSALSAKASTLRSCSLNLDNSGVNFWMLGWPLDACVHKVCSSRQGICGANPTRESEIPESVSSRYL